MGKKLFLLSLFGLLMTSCLVPQKMVYMKDMRPEILYMVSQKPEMKIQPQDRLKIMISSRNPELSAPFNMGVGGYQIGSDGDVRTTATTAMQDRGYLVDRQGNIEFPILGMIRVEGLTKQEVAYQIKNRLREERMITDATVTVDIINFKITVIGEVNSAGVQSVEDENITLLEAIIRAGGVSTNASMGEVLVIREDKRGFRSYQNDLRTVAMYNSPTFYLQQNDLVYVKPRAPQRTTREDRAWQYYSIALGMVSTFVTLLLYVNYFKK